MAKAKTAKLTAKLTARAPREQWTALIPGAQTEIEARAATRRNVNHAYPL